MKLKKIALLIIVTIFTMMFTFSMFSKSYAATATDTMWLKLVMLRSGNGYGYKALEKNVWKIVKTNSSGTIQDYSKSLYCLKGGPGFGSSTFGSGDPKHRPYTEYFDMKTATSTSIPSPYSDALPSFTSETYKSLLWLLDNIYITPKSDTEKATAEEYRKVLMEKAGVGDYIKDDDIDAVQQLAIWHFTNKDTYTEYCVPDNGTFEFWVNAVAGVDSSYAPLSDNKADGEERAEECQALYDYLVETATAMGKAGYTPTTPTKPYEIDKTLTKTQKVDGSNIVIGPFKIKKLTDDTTATIKGVFKNGNIEITPILQDAAGNKFNKLEDTIKDGKGKEKEFYIVLPKTTNIEKITFEISGSYFINTATYWAVDEKVQANDQPVVEVTKTKQTYDDKDEYIPPTPEPEKHFDLSLRKFITAVDNTELKDATTGKYIREPQVDVGPLKNGGKTATYTHPKTPVQVENGNIVTYTLRIYNEGNQDGYAEEIKDNLPEGLEFLPTHATNQTYRWKMYKADGTETTNLSEAKTVRTDYLSKAQQDATGRDNLLKAFDANTMTQLPYKDVKIAFKVIEPNSSDRILVNIAEISKDSNDDRDSIPDNDKEDEDDIDKEYVKLKEKYFDLALRKFITAVNDTELRDATTGKYIREPQVDVGPLKNGGKTATYTHPKTPVEVENGNIVTYTLRIYNEGNQDGYAEEIKDNLPEGLEFLPTHATNQTYRWKMYKADGTETTNLSEAKTVRTDYLSKAQQDATGRDNLLKAFDANTMTELPYKDVKIAFKVIEPDSSDRILVNIAEISKDSNDDRDSTPDNDKEDEDDIDKEYVKLKEKFFDLALRKFITAVNDTELKNTTTGKYIREPQVDVSPLIRGEDTAIYNHPKKPVSVAVGDKVTYTIRVYNEGQLDGYVKRITDHLPQYLEFDISDPLNTSYGWKVSNNGRTVTTDITSPNTEYSASRDTIYENRREGTDKVLLKKFENTMTEPDYIEVKIRCIVKGTNVAQKLTNIAEISDFVDANGKEKDKDSQKGNVTLPNDTVLPSYKDDQIASGKTYIPGEQDDDDFEKVIIEKFDLALRKFITAVNDKKITNRVPVFSMDADKKYQYTHPKTPVEVANGDIVTYTLRIYNEGNKDGYAEEVKDNVPQGLEYLPNNEINKEYRWKMYKADGTETTKVSEAKTIRTDYLSKAQEDATGRKNLIKAFDTTKMTQPDFKEVKIAFKVTEPNTSDRIIINKAEISKDSDDDTDSEPDNDKDNEDDIDIEKVKVKYFDLSLKKIIATVTKKIDGKTTVTQTKHKFDVEPEPVVKLELKEHDIKNAVIKFTYKIRVKNEGEIEGYVKEIRDYIPKGLKFVKKDNPKWKLSDDGKTVTTDQLKDKLLKPGESAIVEITFQWINGQNNLGLKKNIAEISKDYNDHDDTDDIDSTPDNKKDGEDDIDDASVVLSVTTGATGGVIALIGAGVLIVLATGLVLIKRYVI